MTEGAYAISNDLTNIVIPSNVFCNDYTKEGFAGVSGDVVVNASHGAPIAVELKRPFAMLNFATTMNSVQKAQMDEMKAEVTLTCERGVAESYNVLTDEVTSSGVKIYTFTETEILGTECVNDHVTYIRLTSCYVMPVENNIEVTANIVVKKGNETIGDLTVEKIPLTMNYSTNLYGKILE